MFRIYIVINILFFFGCMAKPKQPNLTEMEAKYFKFLSKECNCSVTREVDVRDKSERINSNDNGFYVLKFDSLSLITFNNIDSLKKASLLIAKELHKTRLNSNFKYSYGHITVFYCAYISSTNSRIESFTYSLEELK